MRTVPLQQVSRPLAQHSAPPQHGPEQLHILHMLIDLKAPKGRWVNPEFYCAFYFEHFNPYSWCFRSHLMLPVQLGSLPLCYFTGRVGSTSL